MFIYIVLLLIVPCIVSILIARYKKCKDLIYVVCTIFFTNIVVNLGSLLFYQKSVINFISFTLEYGLFYVFTSCICGLFMWPLYNWMKRKELYVFRKTTMLLGLFTVNLFVYFSWLLGEAGRQSFDVFLYNLYMPINQEVANFEIQLTALLLFMMIMSGCFLYIMKKEKLFKAYHSNQHGNKKRSVCAFSLMIAMILICIGYPIYSFHLEDAFAYFNADKTFLEKEYVNPNEVTLTWPEEQRNLIYIFMESFESSSFSKELGGLNEVNLLPNLSKRMREGTSFSNHDENVFGGFTSMPQTTVSLSGMITALSGVNNQVPAQFGDDSAYATVPYITTLHDLLIEQGYQSSFMIGCTVDAYQIGPFYRAHGTNKTIGWEEKVASGELDKDHKVWWGFEDKALYEFAKNDLRELAQQEQPFLYTLMSNDTHRVDGYTDPSCPVTSYEYPMQNAIACADYMVDDFLTWIQNQPFYEETTVVIVGDHLGHSEDYVTSLNPQEARRIFNLILHGKSPETSGKTYNRDSWMADMFPTVLSSLGVKIEGNRLGLGVNLFADEVTLLEQYGETELAQSLLGTSPYYMNNFVLP